MIEQFINRVKELKWLEMESLKGNAFLVIYGRRRVGKTELIKRFIKDKKHVYFLATRSSDRDNIESLQREMARLLGSGLFMKADLGSWEGLFREFAEKAEDGTIVVIDEFPYLIEIDPAIPSIFQKIWDETLSSRNIILILNGSSIGMMENHVLGYKSPLYGRRSGQWKLKPFHFKDISGFFPGSSFRERLVYFSFLDGIPHYLKMADPALGGRRNMSDLLFRKGAYLYDEAENLLLQEVRKPHNYFSVLRAIAEGNRRYGDICNRTRFSKSSLSQYLSNLEELHVIRREYPVTQRKRSRNALYDLTDNYYRFWFRFIYPNRGALEEGRIDEVLEAEKQNIIHHESRVFEDVCAQLMWGMEKDLVRIGRWWERNEEIDVVGLKRNGLVLGECKWSTKKVGEGLLKDLEEKAALVQEENVKYYLFSRSGFTKNCMEISDHRDDLVLIGPAELERFSTDLG